MDQKDLDAIAKIVNSAIECSNESLRAEMKQSNGSLRTEMKQSDESLRVEIKQSNESLRTEMNEFEKKMLDRMFEFEQDYGKKIDAIFDVAVMQKDNTKEVYKNQEKFRIQVDDLDTKVFDLDQRVFKLERSPKF